MNLCTYLERAAREFPDRVAVVDPSGREWTYRQLDDTSSRVAGFLAARGVVPGDRVGVIAPKSAEVVATLFGVMKCGAAYVPADYTAPATRNRTLLSDCAVAAVFLDPSCASIMSEWPTPAVPVVSWFAGDDPGVPGVPFGDVCAQAPLAPSRLTADDGLAYIL